MKNSTKRLLLLAIAVLAVFAVLTLFLLRRPDTLSSLARFRPLVDSSLDAAVEAPAPSPPSELSEEAFSARRLDLTEPLADLYADYLDRRPKSVLDLQPFREMFSIRIEGPAGELGEVTLLNLNPYVNAWYLLRIAWPGSEPSYYHLENPQPDRQRIVLDPEFLDGVVLLSSSEARDCPLWGGGASALTTARASKTTYSPLCREQIYLRNPVEGRKTSKEWVTDFLRDHIRQGEKITVFVREKLFHDAYLATSELVAASAENGARARASGAPKRPLVDPRFEAQFLVPTGLGIHLENGEQNRVLTGRWYPVRQNPGIYLSTIQPKLVAPELIASLRDQLNPLDDIEETALVFMTAFDLNVFDLGFSLGTEHPRVHWSERVPPAVRDSSLPGPDGIATVEPLIMNGMISPEETQRVVATFTGGFKRAHGAFKWSDLASRNGGSHYGFIEQGTILSKLQPGLATIIVDADGRVDLKTWTDEDNKDLPRIRHARQNGVPIIEFDSESGTSKPGSQVRQWTLGNWSGSQDKRFRTLRAGACLQESEAGRFLIYGYFSSATPSAMARVFQAYGCRYAMLLDMNALEHTYLAVYRRVDSRFLIQHLIRDMEVLDKSTDGQDLPRFVGFADNRDFFYLTRKQGT